MILKNLLLYLQVFTLTASLTSDNTGKKSNQREESQFKSVHDPGGQYGPAIVKNLERMVAVEENADHWKARGRKKIIPKLVYGPKIPAAAVLRDEPILIKNVAKYYKDKSLLEEYKRTERAIYPSKPTDIGRTGSSCRLDSGGKQNAKPGDDDGNHHSVICGDGFDKESRENVGGKEVAESSAGDEKHRVKNRRSGKEVVCFADDRSSRKSIVLPCHFVSRAFYFVLFPDQRRVEIWRNDGRDSTNLFDCELMEESRDRRKSNATSVESHTKIPPDGPPPIVTDELGGAIPPPDSVPPSPGEEPPKPPTRQEDDITAPKKDSEMPSFDEWKMQQEEEKNKDHKEQNSLGNHAKVKVAPKKEINFASVTCGAKVTQANPEAQNPSFILYENKDQYMINPCSAKKGFTVELCEAVQVQAVELGNTEFFSSLPHVFDVHISERFPVKDWIHLGSFQARNERTIQTFQLEGGPMFAKYIRVDILSHYGNEHFCPLSILRVFGNSLDDDDEVETSPEEADDSDIIDVTVSLDGGKPSNNNNNNLFSKATDTVISIMKTVLPSRVDESHPDTDNDTGVHADRTEPPNTTASIEEFKTTTESVVATVEKEEDSCLFDLESRSSFDPTSVRDSILVDPSCRYRRLLQGTRAPLVCPNFGLDSSVGRSKDPTTAAGEREDVKIPVSSKEKKSGVGREGSDGSEEVDDSSSISKRERSESPGSDAGPGEVRSVDRFVDREGKIDGATTTIANAEASAEKHDRFSSSSSSSSDCTEHISSREGDPGDSTADRPHGDRLVDGPPKGTRETNTSYSSKGGTQTPQSGVVVGEGGETTQPSSTNQKRDGPSNEATPPQPSRLEPLKDYDFDASNLDDVTYQKLSSKGKESVFAKLKNRIKNLEISLNLTNRYLEELSQRYKKQTEEMYTSLNKTISKLINTAKTAEERDLRQQDRIQSLEIRFTNISGVLSSLHRSFQDVHSQVLERHLILMAVEFALFFALLTYCQGGGGGGGRRSFDPSHSRRSSAPVVPFKSPPRGEADNRGDAPTSEEAGRVGEEGWAFREGEGGEGPTRSGGKEEEEKEVEKEKEETADKPQNTVLLGEEEKDSNVRGDTQIDKSLDLKNSSGSSRDEDIEKTTKENFGRCRESLSLEDATTTTTTTSKEGDINDRLVFIDCGDRSSANGELHDNDDQPDDADESLTRDGNDSPVESNLTFVGDVTCRTSRSVDFPPAENSTSCRGMNGKFACFPEEAFPGGSSLSRLTEKKRRQFRHSYRKKLSNWTRRYSEYLNSRSFSDASSQYYPKESGVVVHVKYRPS